MSIAEQSTDKGDAPDEITRLRAQLAEKAKQAEDGWRAWATADAELALATAQLAAAKERIKVLERTEELLIKTTESFHENPA